MKKVSFFTTLVTAIFLLGVIVTSPVFATSYYYVKSFSAATPSITVSNNLTWAQAQATLMGATGTILPGVHCVFSAKGLTPFQIITDTNGVAYAAKSVTGLTGGASKEGYDSLGPINMTANSGYYSVAIIRLAN
ncbi:MAG: hypothetical protein WC500_06475 [Candidatus Margulisiibacteriota bacterium]